MLALNGEEIDFALAAMAKEAKRQVEVSAYAFYGEHHPRTVQLALSQPELSQDISKGKIIRRVGECAAHWFRQQLEVVQRPHFVYSKNRPRLSWWGVGQQTSRRLSISEG